MSDLAFPAAGEHPPHSFTEQTEVLPPRVRTESQQMNGIIEDRSSVSSTDMLVSTFNTIHFQLLSVPGGQSVLQQSLV